MAFGKPAAGAARPAPAAGTPPAARTTSATKGAKPEGGKYSGLRPAAARHPLIEDGTFLLEIVKTYESKNKGTGNKWFHADFLILESDNEKFPVGTHCTYMQCVSDNAIEVGGPKVVAFVMAVCGYAEEQEAAFFEDNPEIDKMIDAASGVPAAEEVFGVNPMAGDKVRCQSFASGTGEKKKGAATIVVQYYDQAWAPAEEQAA